MPNPGERAIVTPQDHAQAAALVTDWADRQAVPAHTSGELLELVGMIAAAIADTRARERERITERVELIAADLDEQVAEHYRHARDSLLVGDYSQAAACSHRAHQNRLQAAAVRGVLQ